MFIRFVCRRRALGLALLFLFCAGPALVWANAFPGANRKWHRYESRHVELFSQVSERKSRDLLRDIEALRAFMLSKLDLEVRRPAPITIYFFGSDDDFQFYLPQSQQMPFPGGEKSLGQYLVYPDRDVIMLSPFDGETTAVWVVQTNLAQHLLRSHAGRNPPNWLSTAVALLFGTFTAKKDKVEWGRADDLRQSLVRKFPQVSLEHVFHGGARSLLPGMSVHDFQDLPQAQAWGVLHYWYFGQSDVPATTVNTFIQGMLEPGVASSRERMRALFVKTFGTEYAEMDARIVRYLRAGKFKPRTESFDGVPARESFVMQPLPIAEINRALGELAYRIRSDASGRYSLLQAGAANDARAYEALGAIAISQNDEREASESWERAVDLGSANPAVLRYVVVSEWSRWFARLDVKFRLPADVAERLRSRLRRWIEVLPNQSDAYEALAWVEAAAAEPSSKNVELVQANLPRLTRQVQVRFALAQISARMGDMPGAEKLLAEVESFEPTADERAFARTVADSIRQIADGARANP